MTFYNMSDLLRMFYEVGGVCVCVFATSALLFTAVLQQTAVHTKCNYVTVISFAKHTSESYHSQECAL